jgi:hypothetical protein
MCRERDRRDVLGAEELRNMGAAARAEGMMGSALLHEPADRT